MKVFVVIPAYNEGLVIREVIWELLPLGHTLVIVDDGSTDDTETLLAGLPIHYLRHCLNLGQGAALQTGTQYAVRQNADFIVHFDADGQHPPEAIADLLGPLQANTADISLGSRFLRPADSKQVPPARRRLLKVARWFNGLLTGIWLSDAHNGLRAFSRQSAQRMQLTDNRMGHATQALILIRRLGLRYTEVPVKILYSVYSLGKGQRNRQALGLGLDLLIRKLIP